MAKGKIVIKSDKCKGCELCISVCPKKILEIDPVHVNKKGYHPISVVNEEECIACASCAVMCPDGIINVYAVEEVR
ncbi:MAG TPA: 4Fe-4S binding protein [Anaerovoracaceae bacterium]|nr:4Fe-4S binding protein [Anaerovoracaceae bacterium]